MNQGTPELLKALGEIDPGKPYGTELFDALAKVTVSVAVEAVCLQLRHSPGIGDVAKAVHVYLVQRSSDDTAYPGEWHCPGSVLRPGENIEDVFSRLQQKEFGKWATLGKKQFVVNVNHPAEARGHFFSLVYLCELIDNDIGSWDMFHLRGRWFDVGKLPEKTVETHRTRIIPAAVGAFVAENTEICV